MAGWGFRWWLLHKMLIYAAFSHILTNTVSNANGNPSICTNTVSFCISLMWFRIFYTNQMFLCIKVALLWKRQEPAMMCMTHRRQILAQFEGKKTCPRYFIQFKNRLRCSRFDPSNATSRNFSAVLPWITWLGCVGHRSAHCVGWFSSLLLPSFYILFYFCLKADERYDFAGVTEVKNSGKPLWNGKGERSCVLHKRVDHVHRHTNLGYVRLF